MKILIWLGIGFCISQSAIFSGLNLAFFSISRLRLEIETSKNNRQAHKVLALREDSNFLLTPILWGNVGINVGIVAPMSFFPFGGRKDSFFGVLHGQGRDVIRFFTDPKIVIERWF